MMYCNVQHCGLISVLYHTARTLRCTHCINLLHQMHCGGEKYFVYLRSMMHAHTTSCALQCAGQANNMHTKAYHSHESKLVLSSAHLFFPAKERLNSRRNITERYDLCVSVCNCVQYKSMCVIMVIWVCRGDYFVSRYLTVVAECCVFRDSEVLQYSANRLHTSIKSNELNEGWGHSISLNELFTFNI